MQNVFSCGVAPTKAGVLHCESSEQSVASEAQNPSAPHTVPLNAPAPRP